MNRIVHFEIPSDNPEKLNEFYAKTFGWKFNRWGNEEYWLAETGEKSAPGINGAIMKKRDPQQPMVNTIEVENVDAMCASIEKNGGTIVVPKMPVPNVGWLAYFKDIDGNIFGVMQNDPGAK